MRAHRRFDSRAEAFCGGRDHRRGCCGGTSRCAAFAARASAHGSRARSLPQRLEQARFAQPHEPVITRTLALSLLALTAACGESSHDDASLAVSTARAASAPKLAAAESTIPEQRRTAITEAVGRVAPTVVTVQTEVVDRSTDPF